MPFKMIRNDITKMTADAIVNTANPKPIYFSGTDRAIYEAAGPEELLEERRKIGVMHPGEAAITPAFALDAKFIIHTVGPAFEEDKEEIAGILQKCYENSLNLALDNGCQSIAFPLISTGIYGYPKQEALQIAISEISRFLLKQDMTVYMVVFDEEAFELSGKLFMDVDSYIDENYVYNKYQQEYRNQLDRYDELEVTYESDDLHDLKLSEDLNTFDLLEVPDELQQRQEFKKQKKFMEEPKPFQKKLVRKRDAKAASYSACKPFHQRSIEDVVAQPGETFQEKLFRLIDEKGMTDTEVYKKANLDKRLFSKIRCNADYKPKKQTALALAIALKLSLDETKDLLARAGLALSPSSKSDLIVEFFIQNEVYDVFTINLTLFHHDLPSLGD